MRDAQEKYHVPYTEGQKMPNKQEGFIRDAETRDIEKMLKIYAPFITDNATSFELVVPTIEEFRDRVLMTQKKFPWFVYEVNSEVVGYAYASEHRSRCAYGWSVETSVYVDANYQRNGIARKLYAELFSTLKKQGAVNVFVGITLPGTKSVGFHESMGFEPIGIYKGVGYKFGNWHDVGWWQLVLQKLDSPSSVIAYSEFRPENVYSELLLD